MAAIIMSVVATIVSYFIYNVLWHPLSHVPGPITARLGLPLWKIYHVAKQDYAWALKILHAEFGHTIRIGPNTVSTTDVEAARTIYAHGSNFHKTAFYTAFQGPRPNIFSTIDAARHATQRKTLSSVYSMNAVTKLEEYVASCVKLLVEAFDTRIGEGESHGSDSEKKVSLDLGQWFNFYSVDSMGELAFGHHFDLLSSGKDEEHLIETTQSSIATASLAGMFPFPAPKYRLHRLLNVFSKRPRTAVLNRPFSRVSQRYASISEDDIPSLPDMLGQLINTKYAGTDERLSMQDVIIECANILTAGGNSTAVALCSFIYMLLKHPDAYSRLLDEVDAAFSEGRLQYPIEYAQAVKLPYFQACIKESMRLIPSSAMNLERYVPEGGLLIRDIFLAPGSCVGVNPFVFQHAKDTYGPDAEIFRPERWIEANEPERVSMEKNSMNFGSGARACMGQSVALMEINKLLPTLLHRYSFSISPGHRHRSSPSSLSHEFHPNDSEEDLWNVKSIFFFVVSDFWCDVSLRRPDEYLD